MDLTLRLVTLGPLILTRMILGAMALGPMTLRPMALGRNVMLPSWSFASRGKPLSLLVILLSIVIECSELV